MNEEQFQEGLKKLSEFGKLDLDKYPHIHFVFDVFQECRRRIKSHDEKIRELQTEADYWRELCEGYEKVASLYVDKERGKI